MLLLLGCFNFRHHFSLLSRLHFLEGLSLLILEAISHITSPATVMYGRNVYMFMSGLAIAEDKDELDYVSPSHKIPELESTHPN